MEEKYYEMEKKFIDATQWFEKGINAYKSAEYEIAVEYFKKAVEIYPDCKQAWNYLGEICISSANYKKAQEYILQALKIDPLYKPAMKNKNIIRENLRKLYKGDWPEWAEALFAFACMIFIIIGTVVGIITGVWIFQEKNIIVR